MGHLVVGLWIGPVGIGAVCAAAATERENVAASVMRFLRRVVLFMLVVPLPRTVLLQSILNRYFSLVLRRARHLPFFPKAESPADGRASLLLI